jgi:hypothetical protein
MVTGKNRMNFLVARWYKKPSIVYLLNCKGSKIMEMQNGSNGSTNAGVLAASATTGKRHRRSHQERLTAQLAHLSASAVKDQKRAERLATLATKAQESAKAKLAKQDDLKKITTEKVTARQTTPTATIPRSAADKITREIDVAIQSVAAKHNLIIRAGDTRIGTRGNMMTIVLRGTHQERVAEVASRHTDMSREALHFIEQAKLVGLSTNLINSNVRLGEDEKTYMVVGMKKANNAVVLQEAGTENFLKMSPAEFKAKYSRIKQ